MATAPPTLHLSPEEQRAQLWSRLVCHNSDLEDANNNGSTDDNTPDDGCPQREWPSYDAVISHVATADYIENIKCPHDFISDKKKMICPHGVICCAKMELFPFPSGRSDIAPYSGLLKPDTTVENCVLRLSSAMRPLDQGVQSSWARTIMKSTVGHKLRKAKLVPGAAIKCFRGNGIPSGNLLLLGSKVGQREEDFFAHCQSTQMTEKMPAVALPFVKKFWKYSNYPLSLGLSDLCAHDEQGDRAGADWNFPYSIVFKPTIQGSAGIQIPRQQQQPSVDQKEKSKRNFQTFDSFIDETTHIPIGTTVFEIFAVPDPEAVGDPTRLERIGRVVTTSSMIQSAPTDGLAFRHQIKEDDFMMKPEWKEGIQRKISMDKGKTKGTVGKLAGWRLYEEDIAKGQYIDFEKLAEQVEC